MSWKEICKITNSLPKEEKNLICPSDEKTMSTPRNFIGDHIIYVKNKPIGFIAIFSYPLNWQETKFSKNICYCDLAILPKYRGKGYSTQLCLKGLDIARKAGFDKLKYEVYKENIGSLKLVKKLPMFRLEKETKEDLIFSAKLKPRMMIPTLVS